MATYISYLSLLAMVVIQTDAQFLSPNAQFAQSCGSTADQFVNASDAITLHNPFQTPTGSLQNGSGNWTWNLATTSYDIQAGNTSVEQRLWLDTDSSLDLTAEEVGFIGCGAVMHGLTHDALVKGQSDDGSCSSIFSQACLQAIAQNTYTAATNAGSTTLQGVTYGYTGLTAVNLCQSLRFLSADAITYGPPPECASVFEDDAWLQAFVFASPERGTICTTDPSAGSVSSPLAAWGASSYTAENMASYENLTTSVILLLTVMFTNRTFDDSSSDLLWTEQHLACLRPSVVATGSAEPTGVPSSAERVQIGTFWLLCIAVALLVL